jgi:hypothetical protein
VSSRPWLLIAALFSLLALSARPAAAVPAVTISVPNPASGTVTINAKSRITGITAIQILVDKKRVGSCENPCAYQWDTTVLRNGKHRVKARAVRANGKAWASASPLIKVVNTPQTSGGGSTGSSTPPPTTGHPTPQPSGDPLSLILGPVLHRGAGDSLVAAYDAKEIDLGYKYASEFPEKPDSLIDSVYYDLAFVLYTAYYRTQDSYFLVQARRVARTWRDSANNQAIDGCLTHEARCDLLPPPRSLATLGLAVLALEANDSGAREIVHQHARLIEQHWVNTSGPWGLGNPIMPLSDPREAAYGLIALVASGLLGEDHSDTAKRLLDAILSHQQASGRWAGWLDDGSSYTNNFMVGLLMEALVFYDRAVGDSRILPAVQRGMDWLWSTQWVGPTMSFRYDAAGTVTDPSQVLNGLFLPAWGYAFMKTGNDTYREQGQLILRGLVEQGMDDDIWSVKQFDQVFRSSGQYLGYAYGG